MDKKGGGREYHNFPSKMFRLTLPKCFVEESFHVSENSASKNLVQKRGISQFLVGNRLSHSTDEISR